MKTLIFLFLLSKVLSTLTEANDKNFNELITSNEFVAFLWLEPDNPKNERATEEFRKAAEIILKSYPKAVFAKVNSSEAQITISRINIQKFPYFSIFVESKTFTYDGGYKADDFVTYIRNKLSPTIYDFKKPEELEKFVTAKEVFVFVGETLESNKQYQIFKRVISSFDDTVFASCSSMDCIIHYNIGYDNVLLIKDFAKERKEHVNFDSPSLRSFILENRSPVFDDFNQETAKLIFESYSAGIILYRDPEDDDQKSLDAVFKQAAKPMKGSIYFVTTDIKGKLQQQLAFAIRLRTDELPVVFIHDARKEDIKHYKLQGDITQENINQFIFDWIEGSKLERFHKKENPPETQTGPVMIAVRDTYTEIVKDSNKNAFVLYSAPKCPFCVPVEKDFEKLAHILRKSKEIAFVKINAYDNELDEVIEKYPTIKLFKIGQKDKPILFDWDKNVGKMLDFLKVNLDFKFELSMEDAVIESEGFDMKDIKLEI
jgi:protein disulfide-isomerase A1